MCRWLAYSGSPIYLEQLILEPEHSLIDQSLSASRGEVTTNGDGYGIGWYGERPTPGVYRDIHPAWNDTNLLDLAGHIRSRLFFAHVRAATGGTPVQQTNCHPFRYGRWLFMHNGIINGYERLRRDLVLAVDPELFPHIEGTTDSEVMFHLALTFGLEEDPTGAVERMVAFVEDAATGKGIEMPVQMTLALSDGRTLFAFRYSSEGVSRTLFHSLSVEDLRRLNPRFEKLDLGVYAVVSEPLGGIEDYWEEIPESSVIRIADGQLDTLPFRPS